jgi:hypothetical protein
LAAPEDFFKAGPLQLIGVGVLGLAVPIFFPALRPSFASLLKAGAKLALEAEFDADNVLADRLVDAAVDSLLRVTPQDSEKDLGHKSEATLNRFLAAAHASSVRRGWDAQDVAHRYHKRLSKLDHAISRAYRGARAPQRTTLEHASRMLRRDHVVSDRHPMDAPRANPPEPGAKLVHSIERSQSNGTEA